MTETTIQSLGKLSAAEFLRCLARRPGGVYGEDTTSLFEAAEEIELLRHLLGRALETRAPDYVETYYPGWADAVRKALS